MTPPGRGDYSQRVILPRQPSLVSSLTWSALAVLISAYSKVEQADLTPAHRKAVLALLKELEELNDGEA